MAEPITENETTPQERRGAAFRQEVTDALATMQKRLERIENQTRLARNIQDVSKATQLVWSALGCLGRFTLKAASFMLGVYFVGYMIFHHGSLPPQAHDLWNFIRSDK